jgi:hypothetical protein
MLIRTIRMGMSGQLEKEKKREKRRNGRSSHRSIRCLLEVAFVSTTEQEHNLGTAQARRAEG